MDTAAAGSRKRIKDQRNTDPESVPGAMLHEPLDNEDHDGPQMPAHRATMRSTLPLGQLSRASRCRREPPLLCAFWESGGSNARLAAARPTKALPFKPCSAAEFSAAELSAAETRRLRLGDCCN